MLECVFCKLTTEEWPSAKIWENDEFIAILDINPNTKGASLVIPKKHYHSEIFEHNQDLIDKTMEASKQVATLLKKSLKPSRVAMIVEGAMLDHLHVKLYPMYNVEKHASDNRTEERIYFEEFKGYLTTQLGPQIPNEELQKLAQQIIKC